jgi:hypothetical protein
LSFESPAFAPGFFISLYFFGAACVAAATSLRMAGRAAHEVVQE